MKEHSSKCGMPSNIPDNGNVQEQIYAKPASEVADEFERLLLEMDEDDYNPALVDLYLDALDQKSPMPEMPSKEEAYNNFNQRLLQIRPEGASQSVLPDKHFRRIKLAGLIAIISTICVLSIVAVAQAAGIDVWGKIVSLTDEIFSGDLSVFFTVTASSTMDTLGVSEIDVQWYNGSRWVTEKTYTSTDVAKLQTSDASHYAQSVEHTPEHTGPYHAIVTFYGDRGKVCVIDRL